MHQSATAFLWPAWDCSCGAKRLAIALCDSPVQGNGVERDKLHFQDEDVFILDMYNADLWPGDMTACQAMNINSAFR